MAALENHYDSILTERKGENVRDAIIKAAKALKLYANNAETLGGTPASDFLPSSEYWQLWEDVNKELASAVASDFENDSDIRPGGTKSRYLVTSGEIYNIFDNYVRPSLVAILKYEIDPISDKPMKEAINYYLNEMNKAKEQMAIAIKAKGGSIKKDASLADFATEINGIANDKVIETEPKSVDKNNQTIDANEEHDRKPTDPHYAYSKVTANIRPNYKTLSISQNDIEYTIDAESKKEPWNDPIEGFNSVTVNVPNGKSSSSTSSRRSTGKNGVVVTEDEMLSSKEITEKRVWNASEDSVQGWKTVSVKIELEEIPEGATFKVHFLDDDNEIYIDEVQPFGRAKCRAEDFSKTKTIDGTEYTFSGWTPAPINVTSDMYVKAGWRPISEVTSDEITDSWSDIVGNCGAPYKLGDYKRLVLGNNLGTLYMQKVFEGEDDTTSTWVSMNTINPGVIGINWWNSQARSFLNNELIAGMNTGSDGASEIPNAIIPVLKDNFGKDNSAWGIIELETYDRVWIPSAAELYGKPSDDIVNKLMRCAYNGIHPETGEYRWPRPISYGFWSYWWMNYIGTEKYSVYYDQVYGKSSWDIVVTGDSPALNLVGKKTNTDPMIKKDISNTNAVEYALRSINSTRMTGWMPGSEGQIVYPVLITNQGTYGGGDYNRAYNVPIGFCL